MYRKEKSVISIRSCLNRRSLHGASVGATDDPNVPTLAPQRHPQILDGPVVDSSCSIHAPPDKEHSVISR